MEYSILCLILAITSFSRKIVFCKINVFLIFIFLSGAYSYGYDWIRYREYYEHIFLLNNFKTWIYEPGFSFIIAFSTFLNLDYHWVVVFCSIIICVNIYRYSRMKQYSNFCLFFVFSVFGFMEFSEQIRQGVAISFILLAVHYLLERRNKSFIFYVWLASLFHASAVICLAFLLLFNILKHRNAVMITIVFICLGFMSIYAFEILINHVDSLGLSSFIATKLKGYAQGDGSESGILSSGLLLNLAVIIIAALSTQAKKQAYYSSVILSFFVIQSKTVSIAYRFSYYGYAFIYESFEWLYRVNSGRYINRFLMVIILLIFSFKPLLNPVYRAMFDDYHFFWFNLSPTSVDVVKIRNERCTSLIQNNIKFCSR